MSENEELVAAEEEGDEELGSGPIATIAKTKINKRWLVRREHDDHDEQTTQAALEVHPRPTMTHAS